MQELTWLDYTLTAMLGGVGYCVIVYLVRGARRNWNSTKPTPQQEMEPWLQYKIDFIRQNTPGWFTNKLRNDECPNCNRKITSRYYGENDQFSDHWCDHCGFITVLEVLC